MNLVKMIGVVRMKRGFTLIELIGVVVILGILMIVVFPSIMNNVRKTQGKLNDSTKELLLRATELYIDKNQNEYKSYSESIYCITIQELLDSEMIKEKLIEDIDKSVTIEVKTTNGNTQYIVIEDGVCIPSTKNKWVKANINSHGLDGANTPELEPSMIPIKYLYEQDKTDKWYDYNNAMWANAVVVTETTKEKYKNAPIGTEIKEEDILAYFVWIPRYRYKLWNVEGQDSNPRVIEIEFESNNTQISTGSTNNTWLTHPGFCVGRTGDPTVTVGNYGVDRSSCSGTEVNGLWVAKFEPSVGYSNTVNEVKTEGVMIKPNQISLTYQDAVNQFNTAWSLQTQYNLNEKYITRMIKNTEWGAVTYLTHSKYGIGTNKIRLNTTTIAPSTITDSSDQSQNPSITGCAYKNELSKVYNATSCETENSVPYNNLTYGVQASTTGNIYGIYDMAGGSIDRVASNNTMSDGTRREETGEFYNKIDEKYYDLYGANTNVKNYSIGRLGDATKEMINQETQIGWYNAPIGDMLYKEIDAFIRGNSYYGTQNGIEAVGRHLSKSAVYRDSFRIVMNKQ